MARAATVLALCLAGAGFGYLVAFALWLLAFGVAQLGEML